MNNATPPYFLGISVKDMPFAYILTDFVKIFMLCEI